MGKGVDVDLDGDWVGAIVVGTIVAAGAGLGTWVGTTVGGMGDGVGAGAHATAIEPNESTRIQNVNLLVKMHLRIFFNARQPQCQQDSTEN